MAPDGFKGGATQRIGECTSIPDRSILRDAVGRRIDPGRPRKVIRGRQRSLETGADGAKSHLDQPTIADLGQLSFAPIVPFWR